MKLKGAAGKEREPEQLQAAAPFFKGGDSAWAATAAAVNTKRAHSHSHSRAAVLLTSLTKT